VSSSAQNQSEKTAPGPISKNAYFAGCPDGALIAVCTSRVRRRLAEEFYERQLKIKEVAAAILLATAVARG
jgi:hypothetical protein